VSLAFALKKVHEAFADVKVLLLCVDSCCFSIPDALEMSVQKRIACPLGK
jgi:hypothetical protein